jgi:coenzyme F420 hydrogenase subunit beta
MINKGQKEGFAKMGIVGTPCHMTAVAKMRANPMGVEDFQDPIGMAIGLFCTWALDSKSLIKYVSSKVDIEAIKKMDIPPPPANILVIETDDGKEVKLPLDEVRQFIPNSCSICPDMTSEWADISVGVLEDQATMNTLIIRTERGEELVSSAEKDGYIITEEMPEESLNHLLEASQNKKKKALHLANEQGLLNSNSQDQRSVFRINDSILKKILN